MTYEAGWGKKLSYVIAFAWDHILGMHKIIILLFILILNQDVTKRYTRKWDELKQRRTIVDEDSLANLIGQFNTNISVWATP